MNTLHISFSTRQSYILLQLQLPRIQFVHRDNKRKAKRQDEPRTMLPKCDGPKRLPGKIHDPQLQGFPKKTPVSQKLKCILDLLSDQGG